MGLRYRNLCDRHGMYTQQKTDNKVLVHLRGGDLTIEYIPKTNHVFMTGPATEVFSGEIDII